MSAQNIVDILGCDYDMAQGLLEAAGGDEGLAIELGLGAGGGGGDYYSYDSNGTTTPMSSSSVPATAALLYPLWNRIWPDPQELSPAWKDQRLNVLGDVTCDGLLQPLNGPCGVLAVVQGELWLLPKTTATTSSSFEDRLSAAIGTILSRVVTEASATTSRAGNGSSSDNNKNNDNKVVVFPDGRTMTIEAASQKIRTARELVEAIAATAGAENLVSSDNNSNSSSLVEGPHSLCSSDLICLLMRGRIGSGSFAAWDPTTRQKTLFYTNNNNNNKNTTTTHTQKQRLGMLSYSETQEAGMRVADDLKLNSSVWILHTGDHFMTMRQVENSNIFHVYNGLPPVGPKSTYWTISGDTSLVPPAPDTLQESFLKKRPGQPDDIVQARKTSSTIYKDWTFEVVPAVDDPDVQGPPDDDPNEPICNYQTLEFQTDKTVTTTSWRCASCYATRFQTMNFGINASSSEVCTACHKSRRDAMWSLWQTFDQLSPRMKRRARQMYADKVELLLATLYPNANITLLESSERNGT